jgi:ATP-dependent protease ClpP protease subunit
VDNIPAFRNMTLAKVRMFDRLNNLNPALCHDVRNIRFPWYTIIKNDGTENPIRQGKEPGDPDYPKSENAPDPDTTDIFVYDEIGGSMGISADQFVADLQDVTTSMINLRINSPGGNVFDAIAIHNALRLHPANVTTIVDSLAASAASILFMAGDTAMVMPGSQLMVHDASITDSGNPAEMRKLADYLDQQSDNIAGIYAFKSGTAAGVWRNRMSAETWLTADEAVRLGLADKLWTPPQVKPKNVPPDKIPVLPPDEGEDDDQPIPPKRNDDILDSLMNRRHRLSNRGFKYQGRNVAPDPDTTITQSAIESIIDMLMKGR